MVIALDSGVSGPGSSPDRDLVLCSWAGHLNVALLLFTQLFKWVPAN